VWIDGIVRVQNLWDKCGATMPSVLRMAREAV
jgi:hypothetical protein